MMDQSSRPARKVAIADHIWEAFDDMASSMGTDRDGLINQAMFMFARLNGFLDASGGPAGRNGAARTTNPPALSPVQGLREGPRPSRIMEERGNSPKLDDDPVRREVAERVLETAAELERLIKGKGSTSDSAGSLNEPGGEMDLNHGGEAEERAGVDGEEGALYLMAEGGELDKIAKDRFVIGRGKHCDFVINSGKVSREHAVIVREGSDYYIEDLGSSNGTWFNKQRIKRRKVEDGDEYFICSEKIKLVMR